MLTDNLGRLLGLEGCLSGNRPAGAQAPGGERGPCAALARDASRCRSSTARATFINSAVGEIQDQLRARLDARRRREARRAGAAARAARAPAGQAPRASRRRAGARRRAARLRRSSRATCSRSTSSTGSASTATPRLDDPDFVSTLVFDPSRGATTPKARFAYLFPSPRSAVIQVRLKPGLSDAERRARDRARARARWRCRSWRLHNAGGYTVTGVPVLAEDLADALAGSLLRLLVVGRGRHGARARARLPQPAAARCRSAVALGAVARHLRADGAGRRAADDGLDRRAAGAARAGRRLRDPVPGARARPAGAPPRGARAGRRSRTAALATAAGFLVLLLSPVPMVRGFGLLLVAGIGVALRRSRSRACTAALAARRAPRAGAARRAARSRAPQRGARGSCAAGSGAPARPAARRVRRPGRVLAAGARAGGRRLGRRHADRGRVRPARARAAGPAGRARPRHAAARDRRGRRGRRRRRGPRRHRPGGRGLDAPLPAARAARQRATRPSNGCGRAPLCPALSLPDLFRGDAARHAARASTRCWPPCRPTSRRRSSRATGARRTWPSACGSRRSTSSRR